MANNDDLEWHSYINLVKVCLATYKYAKAPDNSYQALAITDEMEDEKLNINSNLLIGQSLEGNNQKIIIQNFLVV